MLNVHLRINDAATGQPTPVRLRVSDAAGRTYPPLGRLAEFATGKNEDVGGHVLLGRKPWCYVDGACEVPLPSGVPLVVEATKGYEYKPLRHEVTLGTGQMALRLTIERWIDLAKEGWYAGDTRCHFLSPHAALLEAMAEGLSVVHLLAAETRVPSLDGTAYPAVPNMVAFSGQQPALERGGQFVAVNTLNTHPVLGSLALLHCHRAVFPLSFGGPEATDDWSLADWCDQCHRKKGLVVWADPFRTELPVAPEALAGLISQRVDAVEASPTNARVRDWYRAWSAGIRFPLVGASGKDSNRVALGAMRTCAKLQAGQSLDLATWIEAVRAGRTFVTTGPMLEMTVDGRDLGSTVDLDSPGGAVSVRVTCRCPETNRALVELVANGTTLAKVDAPGAAEAVMEREILVNGPTWLAARTAALPQSDAFAHTSPVFVRVGGRMPADAAVIDQYAAWLARTVEWVDADGRFENPRRKDQLRAVLEQARQELLARRPA